MNDVRASLTRRVLLRPSSSPGRRDDDRGGPDRNDAAGDGRRPATTAAIRPVTERRGSIHGGDVRGAGNDAARAAAHALIACNVYLRYLQIAVVEGGPRLGDPEAGTVASLTSTRFSIASGGLAVRPPRHGQ